MRGYLKNHQLISFIHAEKTMVYILKAFPKTVQLFHAKQIENSLPQTPMVTGIWQTSYFFPIWSNFDFPFRSLVEQFALPWQIPWATSFITHAFTLSKIHRLTVLAKKVINLATVIKIQTSRPASTKKTWSPTVNVYVTCARDDESNVKSKPNL